MSDKDITAQVDFGRPDDEFLPLRKCACGHKFELWDFNLSIYREHPDICPECDRKLYFTQKITVYELE